MVRQGARAVVACPGCGTPAPHDVAEWLVEQRLEWTVSVDCAACGSATVSCGWDESPERVRQALVATHGWSRLVVGPPAPSLAVVMKVLRQSGPGQLTLADARQRAGQLLAGQPGGTRVEM